MSMDEERIAELLRRLPPAPEAWVRAAQELPLVRAGFEQLLTRAETDAEFRDRLAADLEGTLEAEGVEPEPALVEALRSRLPGD